MNNLGLINNSNDLNNIVNTSNNGNLNGGNEGEGSINEVQAQILGNDIHRLLKYYLGAQYIVSNIESVKLNIALKSDVTASIQ